MLSRWAREGADQCNRRIGAPVRALVTVLSQVLVERLTHQTRKRTADAPPELRRRPVLVGRQIDLSTDIGRARRHDVAS